MIFVVIIFSLHVIFHYTPKYNVLLLIELLDDDCVWTLPFVRWDVLRNSNSNRFISILNLFRTAIACNSSCVQFCTSNIRQKRGEYSYGDIQLKQFGNGAREQSDSSTCTQHTNRRYVQSVLLTAIKVFYVHTRTWCAT